MNRLNSRQLFIINKKLTRGGASNSYKVISNNIIKDYEIASLNTSIFS